jgi:uncharacterized RDD family membrane protein YckC
MHRRPLAPPRGARHFVEARRATMADSGPVRGGFNVDVKPHAYDPFAHPEYFEGVLARRLIAFVIDIVIITVPVVVTCMFILMFGFVTFGLGWGLFLLVYPGAVIWALLYYGATMGGPASATIGMRAVDLQIRTWYGAPCYFLLGIVHAVVFWVLTSTLTPVVLLVGLLNERRRLLHDLLLGTVIVNTEPRAAALRRYGGYGAGP